MMEHIDEKVEFEHEIAGVNHDLLSRQVVRISFRKQWEYWVKKQPKSRTVKVTLTTNHPPTKSVVAEKKNYVEYKERSSFYENGVEFHQQLIGNVIRGLSLKNVCNAGITSAI